MSKKISLLFGVWLAVIGFAACTTPPDHARYIPKDALMVTALNTKALSKKVAWNIITGSKLFKQMQEHNPAKNAMNLDESGIDLVNTFYIYLKGAGGINGNKTTALIPLANTNKWEAFVKKTFPAAVIKAQGTRKLANIGDGLYAGWSSNLLIVIANPPWYGFPPAGAWTWSPYGSIQEIDSVGAVEMETAFSVTKENALTGNPRFAKVLQEGHDMSFWVNYDQLMTQYMSQGMSKMMGGITLSNVLWKDAVMASGMDFDKGKIAGDMHYYVGDDMRDAAKELGGTNADKDMLDRLAKQNLDMAMTLHLSPKGLKAMLDKTGMLGLANLALAGQGMNADYVMDAFTGDMAIALNDLDVKKTGITLDTTQYKANAFGGYKPSFNAVYVFKINKKENFDKLLQLGMTGTMAKIDNNTYAMPLGTGDSIIFMTGNNYAVVTNRTANALSFIQGNSKGQKNDAAAKLFNHPFGFYADVQEMLKWLTPGMTGDTATDNKIMAAKNLLSNTLVTGGAYSNNSFNYHMDINFMNKDENSLLTLMDFGIKMREGDSTRGAK